MADFYDYYARADTKEQMETLLVGAGLGVFTQVEGVTAFVQNEGVVVEHIGPCVVYEYPDPIPEPNTFERIEIVKDPRWHTNIRTTRELFDAQRVYLPLLPTPKNPVWKLF